MGFFKSLFGGYSQDAYVNTTQSTSLIPVKDGSTGVARYLESQDANIPISKVELYLKNQEKNQPSGVAKYLARQAIAERNKPVVTLTGVAKYLNNNKESIPVVRTGVAKYLDNQDKMPTSRVAKYVLQKSIAERNASPKPKTTRVENYLKNLPESSVSGVTKYLARQSIASAVQVKSEVIATVEAIANNVTLTGVEKYLQAQR